MLAGCGGSHVMRSLPGVAPSNSLSPSGNFSGKLFPVTADPIPDNVLKNPIIGEAWRLDGGTVPPGWVLAQGQALPIADNPKLFSILGHAAGDRATATFAMPKPGFGLIVAAAGMFPTSPAMLAQSARRTSAIASMGPGARPLGSIRSLSAKQQAIQDKRTAAVRQSQQLFAAGPRVGRSVSQRLSPEFVARIDRVEQDARTNALAALSGANQARVAGLIDAILSRRTTVDQAAREMASTLTGGEARALLDVFDETQRALRTGWSGMQHPDPQTEASRYLIATAFTRDQLHALRTMAQSD
jgi:microcystin-dependent protein